MLISPPPVITYTIEPPNSSKIIFIPTPYLANPRTSCSEIKFKMGIAY